MDAITYAVLGATSTFPESWHGGVHFSDGLLAHLREEVADPGRTPGRGREPGLGWPPFWEFCLQISQRHLWPQEGTAGTFRSWLFCTARVADLHLVNDSVRSLQPLSAHSEKIKVDPASAIFTSPKNYAVL